MLIVILLLTNIFPILVVIIVLIVWLVYTPIAMACYGYLSWWPCLLINQQSHHQHQGLPMGPGFLAPRVSRAGPLFGPPKTWEVRTSDASQAKAKAKGAQQKSKGRPKVKAAPETRSKANKAKSQASTAAEQKQKAKLQEKATLIIKLISKCGMVGMRSRRKERRELGRNIGHVGSIIWRAVPAAKKR